MNTFFALVNRMKLIQRWNLMRCNIKEDLMQHSALVAIIGQALGIIRNEVYGGSVDIDKIASLALYHDIAEVISGDLPTPVKYYNSSMKNAYDEIEKTINNRFLDALPTELSSTYEKYIFPDNETLEYQIMKIADKVSAYIKCIEEKFLGSKEFDMAIIRIEKLLEPLKKDHPELQYFLDNFLDSFRQPIDVL